MNKQQLTVIVVAVVVIALVVAAAVTINSSKTKGVGSGAVAATGGTVNRDVMPFSGVRYDYNSTSQAVTNVVPLGWWGLQWLPSTENFTMLNVQNVYQGNITPGLDSVPGVTFTSSTSGSASLDSEPVMSVCNPGEIVSGFVTYGDGQANGLRVMCKSIWDLNAEETPGSLDPIILGNISTQQANKTQTNSSWVSFVENAGMSSLDSGVLYHEILPVFADNHDPASVNSFLAGRNSYKPIVNDPTCVGIPLLTDGTRTSPQELCTISGNPHPGFLAANTACAAQANAVCKTLEKDDPYCACVNASTIPGAAKEMGLPSDKLPPRCLSNGTCMSADYQKSWMSYLGVASDCCPKLTIEICKVLVDMDPAAIVHLANNHIDCSGAVPNTCGQCSAGGGPCVATTAIDGLTACQPHQADGTCAAGFVECKAAPLPPSPGTGSSTPASPVGIAIGAVVAFLIVVFLIYWKTR
jgi:hypothetical protein